MSISYPHPSHATFSQSIFILVVKAISCEALGLVWQPFDPPVAVSTKPAAGSVKVGIACLKLIQPELK